jgi:hypothetical protein
MAAGKSYEELFDPEFCQRIEANKGCNNDEIEEAFCKAGLKKDEDYITRYMGHAAPHEIRDLLWKRKAMIQVDSLNYEKGMHMIYWDGKEIHDPSNKQVYKWMSHVRPVYVWVFNNA